MKNILLLLISLAFAGTGFSQDSKKIKAVKLDALVETSCTSIPGPEIASFSSKCKEGEVAVEFVDKRLDSSCAGDIMRTYTVTDACGNSKKFDQAIRVLDEEAPKFLVTPPDVTFADRMAYQDSPDTKFPSTTDNCSQEIIEEVSIRDEFVDGVTKLFKTYTVIDGCGNKRSHVQEITFNIEQ